MIRYPASLPRRTVGEWELTSTQTYDSPFADVLVDGTFISPSGRAFTIPGFYDGDGTWRIRFNPNEVGKWSYRISSYPPNADLTAEGTFDVTPNQSRGFLQATPGQAWGFHYESGEPVFLFGDTVYNMFGWVHCGYDIELFLRRRRDQGFNILRARLQVSPFHPPAAYSTWQTRRTWPWGGSEQCPRFDLFNLEYFHSVDRAVRLIEEIGLGLEMIMEAWGFEFPFNSRHIFTREWEDLWLRYLIARYDAFNCVYVWTPLNEYEYYPAGDRRYRPVADMWQMRVARWIKQTAQHGHIIGCHNRLPEPPFATRFAFDLKATDAIMFQYHGTRDKELGWLAAGIEDQIERSLKGWSGSAVLAEYGYEYRPAFAGAFPFYQYCDIEHMRRGGWRGVFSGLGVILGFDNTWAAGMVLEWDQPSLGQLLHLRRFITELVPFYHVRPAPEILASREYASGHRPLILASEDRDLIAVYFPVGGMADLALSPAISYTAWWFDPRTGSLSTVEPAAKGSTLTFTAPGGEENGHPWDWALILQHSSS